MTIYQKFGGSFAISLSLHLLILMLFWLNIGSESEVIKQKPLPEIITASILDDQKIQQQAERLKDQAENKRILENKQKKNLENKLKKQQKLLKIAQKKRQQEERKIKALKKKQKQQILKEQQRQKKIEQQKVQDAARLARIKKQQLIAKKRADDLQKAKDIKREQRRQEEQKKHELAAQAEQKKREFLHQQELKKEQQLLLQQQAQAAAKAADLKRREDAKKAQQAKDAQTKISITAAIQQRVNNQWIRPISSAKGLNCEVRVKLLPTGDVMDVLVTRSSGDSVFDRSAENAVRKASPLPVPKSRALFSNHFREFTFKFNPD